MTIIIATKPSMQCQGVFKNTKEIDNELLPWFIQYLEEVYELNKIKRYEDVKDWFERRSLFIKNARIKEEHRNYKNLVKLAKNLTTHPIYIIRECRKIR